MMFSVLVVLTLGLGVLLFRWARQRRGRQAPRKKSWQQSELLGRAIGVSYRLGDGLVRKSL